jgi:hypothetical protein
MLSKKLPEEDSASMIWETNINLYAISNILYGVT